MHDRIRAWMELARISQKELAERLGLTNQAVYYWLTGHSVPTTRHMEALVDALGTTLDKFYGPIPKRRRVS